MLSCWIFLLGKYRFLKIIYVYVLQILQLTSSQFWASLVILFLCNSRWKQQIAWILEKNEKVKIMRSSSIFLRQKHHFQLRISLINIRNTIDFNKENVFYWVFLLSHKHEWNRTLRTPNWGYNTETIDNWGLVIVIVNKPSWL